MNTFAHLVLGSETSPEAMQGQFLGDFCRGAVEQLPYSPAVRLGIRAHRRVDAVGDPHPFTREVKAFLEPPQRRYGGIVLDLLCDWLLHEHWDELELGTKREVLEACRHMLQSPHPDWPVSAQRFAKMVLDHDLLEAYTHLSEVRYAVGRIGLRLQHPQNFQPILNNMLRETRWLHQHFPAYFEDMRHAANQVT